MSAVSHNVLFLGASKGCGFYAALKVLQQGGRGTFLLRKPDAFTSNPQFLELSAEQRARATIVKGDGLIEADVQKALDAAGPDMNEVVYSIGGAPSFTLTRGLILDPPKPCARTIAVILPLLHKLSRPGLRLVVISTMGLGQDYYLLPLLLRPIYALLHVPHMDKVALEYLALNASVFPTPPVPSDKDSLPEGYESQPSNWLEEVILVQPALLTDGKEFGTYRKAPKLGAAYTISRRDIGHFIVAECLKPNNSWVGAEGVIVGY